MMKNKQIGLYIHIPFCKSKCYYCDFNSFAGMEKHIDDYFNALKKEILISRDNLKNHKIKSVFFGGGTPSYAEAKYICDIMDLCKNEFNFIDGAEITIESNPGTLTYEKLCSYKDAGINRLSIGLQAWQDRMLKSLGRIHSNQEFVDNFKQARKAGFDNINVDLIFGLPGQTLEDWKETLTNVVELNVEHLSCYSLKIEDNTPFGEMLNSGKIVQLEEEADREMYYLTKKFLKDNNFKHYEISNFAKPSYECRHNLIYWKAEEYIGLGAGAHSYFNGERYSNVEGVSNYIDTVSKNGVFKENVETIDEIESMSEFVILGLRLIDGVNCDEFFERYEKEIFSVYGTQIEMLTKKSLIEHKDSKIKLSPLGLDLANEVFVEFII